MAEISFDCFFKLNYSLRTSNQTLSSSLVENVSARVGENVTLPCRSTLKIITSLKWTKPNMGDKYIYQFKGNDFEPEKQHESFKNRVELKDEQMTDGDVSLILKNVTIDDKGAYECHVQESRLANTNSFTTVNLDVKKGELLCACVYVCVCFLVVDEYQMSNRSLSSEVSTWHLRQKPCCRV